MRWDKHPDELRTLTQLAETEGFKRVMTVLSDEADLLTECLLNSENRTEFGRGRLAGQIEAIRDFLKTAATAKEQLRKQEH